MQPVVKVEVSAEDVAQAVTNRAAIAVGSAAGPSSFGATLSIIGHGAGSGAAAGWKREGVATIRKRSDQAEADFWKAISASGHLAVHLPVLYDIHPAAPDSDDGEGLPAGHTTSTGVAAGGRPAFDIFMQDLVAPMVRPCALALLMGSRTVTAAEMELDSEETSRRGDLLTAMCDIDPAAPTPEEHTAGGVTAVRFLNFLDATSSTTTLGFRIDAGKTVTDGALTALPLPAGHTSFNTLREEADIAASFVAFLQSDAELAATFAQKVQALHAALARSSFFAKHVLLRSTLLFVYDDAARTEHMELKMMNFGSSYAISDGAAALTHKSVWDGRPASHEDGYLLGVENLERILKTVCDTCAAASAAGGAATND